MSKSIMFDCGHGGSDPGTNGYGVLEKDWNLKMSMYQYLRMKELGAKVNVTRTGDQSLDSVKRTNLIKNKYDICVSNHFNGFDGKARGIETIHSIYSDGKLAKDIAAELVKVTGLPLRRVFTRKAGNGDYYFMHRLTGNTETVIVEYGFMDNKADHDYYKNDANFIKAAESVVKVLCQYAGVPYKPVQVKKPAAKPKGKLYKVQTGAFSSAANAERLAKELKKAGFDSYIVSE